MLQVFFEAQFCPTKMWFLWVSSKLGDLEQPVGTERKFGCQAIEKLGRSRKLNVSARSGKSARTESSTRWNPNWLLCTTLAMKKPEELEFKAYFVDRNREKFSVHL